MTLDFDTQIVDPSVSGSGECSSPLSSHRNPNKNWGLYLPPRGRELETSVFPSTGNPDHISRLDEFKHHMGGVLSLNPDFTFQEYCLTFCLGYSGGNLGAINARMRCFVQILENGELILTNRQLTFKSNGNNLNRKEIETDHNLPSFDFRDAMIALEKKYGGLSKDISGLDLTRFYVDAIALNSRDGFSGEYAPLEKGKILTVTANDDRCFFLPPCLVDNKGQPIIADFRPEVEFEIAKMLYRAHPGGPDFSHRIAKRCMKRGLVDLRLHAKKLFSQTHIDNRCKTEAAQDAVRRQATSDFMRIAHSAGLVKPADFETADFIDRLKVVLAHPNIPSPFRGNKGEQVIRQALLANAMNSGQTQIMRHGYSINL